jgi:hypothetical protein
LFGSVRYVATSWRIRTPTLPTVLNTFNKQRKTKLYIKEEKLRSRNNSNRVARHCSKLTSVPSKLEYYFYHS